MLNIQVTSMDDAWAQDKLNTALNSLETQMSSYKQEETDQEFADFCYSGSILKPYNTRVEKPLTEVPLMGIDDCGNQFNVGYIDTGGNVKFYSMDSIRHIKKEDCFCWTTSDINIIVGYDFGAAYFFIGGNGPMLRCNCLLYPCVCEDLCPQYCLDCASYEYNVELFYCCYPWTYNTGQLPDDIVGWYTVGAVSVCVCTQDFNRDCLSCTCSICTICKQCEFVDEQGICWTVTNDISTCCVYETWQGIPDNNPVYCEINGCKYMKPIFWCNYCNSKHWAYGDKMCDPVPGGGGVGDWYCWYEATNNLDWKDDTCWNPNTCYFHCNYMNSCFKMCNVYSEGSPNAWVGKNLYQECLLKNYAKEMFCCDWDPSIQAIPYDKCKYERLKCAWCNAVTHKRAVKGGFVSTTNHALQVCTCVCMSGTSVLATYPGIKDVCQLEYGWQVPSGYMPLYFQRTQGGVALDVSASSRLIHGDANLYAQAWPSTSSSTGYCTLCTPYRFKSGRWGEASINEYIADADNTNVAYCNRHKDCGVTVDVALCWFNKTEAQIYTPYNYCRLTHVYDVHQYCYGVGNLKVSDVNIRVRYKKAKSGVGK